MRDEMDRFEKAGANVVLVGNGSASFAEGFREDVGWNGPLLIDTELRSYRAAGLRRGRVEALSPRMLGNATRALRAGFRQDGVQGDPWQLGGLLVIRPGNRVTFSHASQEAGDHADLDEVVMALGENAPTLTAEESGNPWQRLLGRGLSTLVDPTVLFSFDQTGFRIHALTYDPADLQVDLSGRRCVVTGANSGIGFETALALADLGAEVVMVCRNEERGKVALDDVIQRTGNPKARLLLADLSDLDSVRKLGGALDDGPLDVLVHNAGILPDERGESGQGHELTFATHVLGPHLLTRRLAVRLREARGRVIWVSSGGMYTRGLQVDDPEWEAREYDGVTAYAETKRAQVILSQEWARRLEASGVTVHAMHPGWAATPAVASSLPNFNRFMEGRLRTPAEGADTVVWLAASEAAGEAKGGFYFDRERRRTHWLPGTRESHEARARFLALCDEATKDEPEGAR